MVSLVNALRSFQSGALSREELYAEVDQILQNGRVNESWLLKTLEEENTKVPLPEDIREVVHSRIEKAAQIKEARQTRASEQAASDDRLTDPDASRTMLATSLYVNDGASADAGRPVPLVSPAPALGVGVAEPVRMKGKGDVLNNRFVLEECVGSGGMSTVYRALDRRKLEADDRYPYVAVKVLNLEFRAHPDSLIALQREAKKSQSLAHPNIVRVYDFDRDGSTVYMTMEYLSGESLAQKLRAPGFKGYPWNEAMRILEGIACALIFAHNNGIIHADFKPANVILTDKGEVKVIDFGIARAFKRPDDSDLEATRFDPGSLGALTPTYASPEMLEQQKPDPRDDVYALACIAYEMLTGRHPFGRMQATEARDGGLQLERRNLNRKQWKAMKAALDFDRGKRTPSVEQFINDLRPQSTLSVSAPAYATAKMAVPIVLLGGLIYYFVNENFLDRYLTNHAEVADAGDTEFSGVAELASLQQAPADQRAGISSAEVELAGAINGTASNPAQDSSAEPQLLAKVPAAVERKLSTDSPPELTVAGVRSVLDTLPCSAFDVSVQGGAVQLQGYVSREFDMDKLESQLLALPGATKVSSNLKRVVASKCPIVEVYAPYWIGSKGAGGKSLTIQSNGGANEVTEGEPLVVRIETPAYQSYVNVDYYSLDGGVIHMIPSPRAKENQAPPNYAATIGDLGEWTISEPFGEEMVAVLMTPVPLFDRLRDEYESKSEYLAAVQERLELISQKSGADQITADFVMINTRPRSLVDKLKNIGQPQP